MKTFAADEMFSLCIRERAEWRCERCGNQFVHPTSGLHCAHFKGRGRWSTRFHPDNAASCCYGCHRYLDTHDAAKDEFFMGILGVEIFSHIERESNIPLPGVKGNMRHVSKHFRGEFIRLRSLRSRGKRGRLKLHECPVLCRETAYNNC